MIDSPIATRARLLAQRWGGPLHSLSRHASLFLSLATIGVIAYELRDWDWRTSSFPMAPTFWVAFLLYYLGSPLAEWTIMRRLWQAPASAMGAVMRKMVFNELLFSYSGDAFLYGWLRSNLRHIRSAFAVVKDLALISALMGSVAALVSIAILVPLLPALHLGSITSPLFWGVAFALASGGMITFFSKRLLSLSRSEILFIAACYGLRILGQAICAMAMWHALLPQVPLRTWLLLSAIRLLSSRLPLFASKELAFATATVAVIGSYDAISPMIVTITGLIVSMNILVGITLSLEAWIGALGRRKTALAA